MHFKPAPLLTRTIPLGSDPNVSISILILLPSRNANPPSKLNGARYKLYGELKRFNKVCANDVALPRRAFVERRCFSSGVVKGKHCEESEEAEVWSEEIRVKQEERTDMEGKRKIKANRNKETSVTRKRNLLLCRYKDE